MRIVLSARAEAELADIFADSIARRGEGTAKKYAEQLDQRLMLIAKNVTQGRARPELGDGVRSSPAGSHLSFSKLRTTKRWCFRFGMPAGKSRPRTT
ncbi:MAG: type II toxin-antitoxin system RelE/ParE family toxin [Hyphomonadaceae bacterium]|nr:type II toxin-antitoxin system RelE/ParE family toxin [Hyphomonadaceae bacterium]